MKNPTKNVIIPLKKDLGEQMFQWAFARSLKQKFYLNIYFDKKKHLKLNKFKLSKELKLNNFFKYLFENQKYYQKYNEKTPFKFDLNALDIKDNCIINGIYQTEKYFKNIKNILIEDFSLKDQLNKLQLSQLEHIKSCNSVSVEIINLNKDNGTCNIEYYLKAIEKIKEICKKDITLFIFSDNIKACKKKLKLKDKCIFIKKNNKNEATDLELIKNCKHNIIANSSFSWWSAWLNQNPDKIVIAPKPWSITLENINEEYDLIPEKWERIYAHYDYPYFVI